MPSDQPEADPWVIAIVSLLPAGPRAAACTVVRILVGPRSTRGEPDRHPVLPVIRPTRTLAKLRH
ncbi:hypothetical protein C3743_31110 [Burkholderia contaminans]|uniref:Uncharacterized protein n=1 Tax=Burkholderia contaminans TaxID=488447 RepID=A0A2S5DZB7_9BURK|nr:hypothetical protein C3743_31110 [Burkholderia contaminans]